MNQSFADRAVELCLGKIGRRLLQDLVGRAQLLVLALQLLDPGLVGAASAGPVSCVALRLQAPLAKRAWEQPSFSAIELQAALSLDRSARFSSARRISVRAEFVRLPRGVPSLCH